MAPGVEIEKRELPATKICRSGSENLTLAEILSLLLAVRQNTQPVAESLHLEYGARLISQRLSVKQVMQMTGIRRVQAIRLLAAVELGRRLFDPARTDLPVIHTPADVYTWVPEMRRLRQEHFRCLYLNSLNRVVGDRTISIGTVNSSLVHPRDVFHGAVEYAATSIILIHNHPSGNPEPSDQDLRLTRQIRDAGKLFSVPVLDHLIITDGGFYSFKDHARL